MPRPSGIAHETITITPLHIQGGSVQFPSIITQFSDQWTPQWNATSVYGRMDPVSFYSGTRRELTLGFRVIGESAADSAANTRDIQRLIQFQYPRYQRVSGITGRAQPGDQRTIVAPPYFSFRFLNLLNSGRAGTNTLYGYIMGSIQVQPGFQDKSKLVHFNNQVDPTHAFFSDVEIVLRIQVLHQGGFVGFGSPFSLGENYPYGIGSDEVDSMTEQAAKQGAPIPTNLTKQDAAAATNAPSDTTPKGSSAPGAAQAATVTRHTADVVEQGRYARREVLTAGNNWWNDVSVGGKYSATKEELAADAAQKKAVEKTANRQSITRPLAAETINSDIFGPGPATDEIRTPKKQRSAAENLMKDLGIGN